MARTDSYKLTGRPRNGSEDSSYDSDFSVNTGGFTLTNQKEISEQEFAKIQGECMEIIKIVDDAKSHLEFKKLFNTIKPYYGYNDYDTFEGGWSFIHEAARYNNIQILHFLLTETDIDPNMIGRRSLAVQYPGITNTQQDCKRNGLWTPLKIS